MEKMKGYLGLLVLSSNCQKGSLLVFMLANFGDQNGLFKSQISYPCKSHPDGKQGCLDA
jgi:hypothetical protein